MSSTLPKVSVGMPVRNAGRYLVPAIEAILAQSFADFELLISDNASTDGSYDICLQYAARDPRVIVTRQSQNIGAPRNYRAVAEAARAPYFKWASANDLIHPDFLRECVATLDARPDCVLCYPRTRLFSESTDDATDYDDKLDLQFEDPVHRFSAVHERLRLNNVLNGLIRREALMQAGVMPDFFSGDVYLVAELGLQGKFIEIPKSMFYRRMNPDTVTRLRSAVEIRRHFYPKQDSQELFQAWKQCAASTRSVLRTRLSTRDKVRGLALTGRMWLWNRRDLGRDLREAVNFVFRPHDEQHDH